VSGKSLLIALETRRKESWEAFAAFVLRSAASRWLEDSVSESEDLRTRMRRLLRVKSLITNDFRVSLVFGVWVFVSFPSESCW